MMSNNTNSLLLVLVLVIVVVITFGDAAPPLATAGPNGLQRQLMERSGLKAKLEGWMSKRSLRSVIDEENPVIDHGFMEFDFLNYDAADGSPNKHFLTLFNRTTIPLGRCVRNVMNENGNFMKLFSQRKNYVTESFPVFTQGFSDSACRQPVGQTTSDIIQKLVFTHYVFYWWWLESLPLVNVHYEAFRNDHPLGLILHWYGNANCLDGDHVDQYIRDRVCQRGYLVNPLSQSYQTNIFNDTVTEYSDDKCFHPLSTRRVSDLALGHCNNDRQVGSGLGFVMSIGTGTGNRHTHLPTLSPTALPSNFTEIVAVDTGYSGRLTPEKSVEYFQFSYTRQVQSNLAVILDVTAGNANLYVLCTARGVDFRCEVGSTCFSCAVHNSDTRKVCDFPATLGKCEVICYDTEAGCLFSIAVERDVSSKSEESTASHAKFDIQIAVP
jgi:hypothetical protein